MVSEITDSSKCKSNRNQKRKPDKKRKKKIQRKDNYITFAFICRDEPLVLNPNENRGW